LIYWRLPDHIVRSQGLDWRGSMLNCATALTVWSVDPIFWKAMAMRHGHDPNHSVAND
jgi:hypothetical protein